MSKQGRTLPNPTTSAEAPPPDLSGGGDTIMEAAPEGRSTRPGPQPKVIRETFSNPGMMTSPDVKVLNERKYDSARSKVRTLAIEKMPDLAVGTKLPGPAPLETEDDGATPETPASEAETPADGDKPPELDEKTAAQIAAKDRENRQLRQKMRAIEQSGMSAQKKETKLRELAKTNPRGVADYLGIDFMTYLQQVQKGEQTPIEIEDKPAAPESDETQRLRDENERLRAADSQRTAKDVVAKRIGETRGDDGKLRWGRVARVGDSAIQNVVDTVVTEMAKMRKLTKDEAFRVVDHFLDAKEAEYKRASAADDTAKPTRNAPNPRSPQKVPAKSPMEFKHAKDEGDPRNRPSSREIAARLRARLIGS